MNGDANVACCVGGGNYCDACCPATGAGTGFGRALRYLVFRLSSYMALPFVSNDQTVKERVLTLCKIVASRDQVHHGLLHLDPVLLLSLLLVRPLFKGVLDLSCEELGVDRGHHLNNGK